MDTNLYYVKSHKKFTTSPQISRIGQQTDYLKHIHLNLGEEEKLPHS